MFPVQNILSNLHLLCEEKGFEALDINLGFLTGTAETLFPRLSAIVVQDEEDTETDRISKKLPPLYLHPVTFVNSVEGEDAKPQCDKVGVSRERGTRRQWLLSRGIVSDGCGFFRLARVGDLMLGCENSNNCAEIVNALQELVEDETWRLELKYAATENTRKAVMSANPPLGECAPLFPTTEEALNQPSVLTISQTGESTKQYFWYASPSALVAYRLLMELAAAAFGTMRESGKLRRKGKGGDFINDETDFGVYTCPWRQAMSPRA